MRSLTTNDLMKVVLACGLIHVAAYYVAGTQAGEGRHMPVPQPDTLLYCQSARQIAEGMPYVYTPGDRPSTGSTTHVYPMLLGALYKMGARGDALLTAGFVLNALFYLGFLSGWCLISFRLLRSPSSRLAACALLALNGMTAFNALSQSDVGLFMCVSALAFAALLAGRMGWVAALLVVAPWCRPEGAVLAFLFAGAVGLRLWTLKRVSASEWLPACLGVLSAALVFGFNDWLTGSAQYQSLYGKGFFSRYDFFPALCKSITDGGKMMRELFLGIPENPPRDFFFLPVAGAFFAWLGLMARPWRREGAWMERWWLAACVCSLGLVAMSGFEGTNLDRYLAWILPLWLVYMAEGAEQVAVRMPKLAWRPLPFVMLVAFQGVSALWMVSSYYSCSLAGEQKYEFGKLAHKALPPSASVGGESCSLAYAMPGRRFVHLYGFYSPDFLATDVLFNFERLKHHPDWRFDYWALNLDFSAMQDPAMAVLVGPLRVLGLNQSEIRDARWDALDAAKQPADAGVVSRLAGWTLADSLDVGYPEDEARCSYETYSRFYRAVYAPFAFSSSDARGSLFDVGRVVAGYDAFTCRLRPGKPARLILRTLGKVETTVRIGTLERSDAFSFQSPLRLSLRVDDTNLGICQVALSANENAFSEVEVALPAEAIRNAQTRLTLFGDHVACAYWIYQPAE